MRSQLGMKALGAPCEWVYLDLGSNIGDSLRGFAKGSVEARLAEALRVAVGPAWAPSKACVYGFEPNPRWTPRLLDLQKTLTTQLANITIFTETAIGGPEQKAAPMWLVQDKRSKHGVGSSLVTSRPHDVDSDARPVATVVLSDFLRDIVAPRHGLRTPVVIRMDVEGAEYDALFDLATSGVGRAMNLYLTLEWHRAAKRAFLGTRERAHMAMLDDRFHRFSRRCGVGSCNFGPESFGDNSTLEEALEKSLVYMLHRAGVTYVDAYFDIPPHSSKTNPFSHSSPQDWNATRERRESFGALPGWGRRK